MLARDVRSTHRRKDDHRTLRSLGEAIIACSITTRLSSPAQGFQLTGHHRSIGYLPIGGEEDDQGSCPSARTAVHIVSALSCQTTPTSLGDMPLCRKGRKVAFVDTGAIWIRGCNGIEPSCDWLRSDRRERGSVDTNVREMEHFLMNTTSMPVWIVLPATRVWLNTGVCGWTTAASHRRRRRLDSCLVGQLPNAPLVAGGKSEAGDGGGEPCHQSSVRFLGSPQIPDRRQKMSFTSARPPSALVSTCVALKSFTAIDQVPMLRGRHFYLSALQLGDKTMQLEEWTRTSGNQIDPRIRSHWPRWVLFLLPCCCVVAWASAPESSSIATMPARPQSARLLRPLLHSERTHGRDRLQTSRGQEECALVGQHKVHNRN